MKFAIALLVSLALTLSPSFAAKSKSTDKPAEQKCATMADVKGSIQNGAKVEYELSGDELKKFNAQVEKSGGHAPDIDGLLVLSKPDSDVWLAVLFKNGCGAGLQVIVDPEGFKKSLEQSKEDGQI